MNLVIPSIFTAVDKFSAPVNKMSGALKTLATNADLVETKFNAINNTASNIASKSLLLGAALGAPLLVAVNEAVKFEDRMADVAKTTGLAGKNLEFLSDGILDYSKKTRTSIEELQKIAAIGGQQGILGEQNILNYTKAVDKFSVALGSDFGGDVATATQSISGLNKLFKETRELSPDKSITQVGSAMNALSAKGVLVPNLNEFALRIGQLPDAIKPSIQSTLALGAVLDKAKIPAEVSARAYGDFVTTASKNLGGFAKQMGITTEEAKSLINTKPEAFLTRFSQSLKGLNAQDISKKLESLKIGDTGTIKLVGALASNLGTLQEFTEISNNEFAKGTSLLNEYNKVNSTSAAKLAQAKNNFQALSIVIGTELLPALTALLQKVSPFIKGISDWAKEHPNLTKVIIGTVAAVSGLLIVMGGFAAIVSTITGFIAAVAAAAPAFLFIAGIVANYLVPALQVALATITVIAEMIAGALGVSVAIVAAGFGLLVSLVASLWRNWDMIVKAFRDGGIIAGIKAIGVAILDSVLAPLQYVLSLIAKITGADWAKNAASGIEKFRTDLGVDVNGNTAVTPAVNPKKVEQDAMVSRTESTQKQNVSIDINDNTGRANVSSSNDMVPITTTRTLGGGLSNKL